MGDDEGESDSLALDFGNHTIVPSGNGPNSTTDASQTYVRGNQTRQNAKNENNIVNNCQSPPGVAPDSPLSFASWHAS